jgi:IclR family acetate operon transcriptional repressor
MRQKPMPKPATAPREAPLTHRSLERGLAILEWVAAAGRPLSLADTARQFALHRSTTHHLLKTLVRIGYLQQDDDTRSYSLTQKLYQLTGRAWPAEQIGEMAQPLLEELTQRIGEGCSVAVWRDGLVRIVAKCETDGPVRVVQDVNAQRPLHCTAVGKALAAWMQPSTLQAALAATRLERHTPKTIVTHAALEAELRRIRNAGYAIDDEEQYEGLRCIAMPVFSHTGEVVASMCVVGPKHRMTHQRLLLVRAPLGEASARLSQRLGHSAATRR